MEHLVARCSSLGGGENKGELRRSGFEATARINRHDFGVSRRDEIPDGGVVVRECYRD